MGALTTHVLDTARGIPASGMKVELWTNDGASKLIKTAMTNADGRLDEPALAQDAFKVGRYELRFYAGDYFRENNMVQNDSDPAFLDIIPLCFGINDTNSHYHVPLLVSPYSYSTYKGS